MLPTWSIVVHTAVHAVVNTWKWYNFAAQVGISPRWECNSQPRHLNMLSAYPKTREQGPPALRQAQGEQIVAVRGDTDGIGANHNAGLSDRLLVVAAMLTASSWW